MSYRNKILAHFLDVNNYNCILYAIACNLYVAYLLTVFLEYATLTCVATKYNVIYRHCYGCILLL